MHVNKFVHPVEKLPKALDPEDIARWQEEYTKPEHRRVGPQMKRIDDMLISLIGSVENQDLSRIKRFRKTYTNDGAIVMDEDAESRAAYKMFVTDVTNMRSLVTTCLEECLAGKLACEKEFAVERTFFMKELANQRECNADLTNQIKNLQHSLGAERDYNMTHYVEQNVT